MKRSRSIRATCATIAAAAALGTANAWGEDIIRLASGYRTATLDPIGSAASASIQSLGQLYSRLLRYDTAGELAPGLAESWQMAEDGETLTLELRDASFSDGSPITAEDVAFSLRRVKSDASAYPAPMAPFTEIAAEGENTVVLTLKYPGSPFLDNLTAFNTGIVSMDDVEERGAEAAFQSDPVTSGPYQVQDWRPNDGLDLMANPHYWRESFPKNDGVEITEVTNANTRIAMLLAGEVDAVRQVPWARIAELRARDDVDLPLAPSTVVFISLLNHDRPPFDDLRVRQAAAHALDTEAITRAVTFGHAEPANTTLPSALDFHDADYPGIEYDPALATELLQAAGGVDEELVILISDSAQREKIATLMQAQWAAIGLDARIEKVDSGTWWTRVIDGDYDAAPTWYYNETLDPDLAVRWALCGTCGNRAYYTNYNNDEVNELIEQAAGTRDRAEREAFYHEIQAITTEEVSQIPLYYPPFSHAYSERLEGLTMTPVEQWTFERAHLVE